jgi:hypothetical protein
MLWDRFGIVGEKGDNAGIVSEMYEISSKVYELFGDSIICFII